MILSLVCASVYLIRCAFVTESDVHTSVASGIDSYNADIETWAKEIASCDASIMHLHRKKDLCVSLMELENKDIEKDRLKSCLKTNIRSCDTSIASITEERRSYYSSMVELEAKRDALGTSSSAGPSRRARLSDERDPEYLPKKKKRDLRNASPAEAEPPRQKSTSSSAEESAKEPQHSDLTGEGHEAESIGRIVSITCRRDVGDKNLCNCVVTLNTTLMVQRVDVRVVKRCSGSGLVPYDHNHERIFYQCTGASKIVIKVPIPMHTYKVATELKFKFFFNESEEEEFSISSAWLVRRYAAKYLFRKASEDQ